MALTFPEGARYAVFAAEVPSAAEINTGSTLKFGGAKDADEALHAIEIPPRQPVTLMLPIADLSAAHDGAVRFTIAPSAVAKTISSSGTRILYVGSMR